MAYKYIKVPKSVSLNQIEAKGYTLSSSQYMELDMPNKNYKYVRDFLARELKRSDLGKEVGSLNYIEKSPNRFLRTKALQSISFLPEISSQTALYVHPNAFVNMNLKEGDLLISKDSNIGEIVILDQDYPNIMLSGAIYKLPVNQNKLYLLAFIKHDIFREQLDFMVPKGATIRHAKTMFLDCKIPMPNKNSDEVVRYIECLTKAVIEKEKKIIKNHQSILSVIEEELVNNQKPKTFEFNYPTIDEIKMVGRIDTARYSMKYKEYEFLIKNYVGGYFNLSSIGYNVKRGQNLQVSNIGQSQYFDDPYPSFYKLAVSSNFSEYSTVIEYKYLGNSKELNKIKKGDIIFSARGAQFGRVVVFPENVANTITNIDSLVIRNKEKPLWNKIFIAMFLNNLRQNKHIYDIAITGSGANSLTQYQSDDINFPNFPENKQKEIANLYFKENLSYDVESINLNNFLDIEGRFNESAGIVNLDKYMKKIKERLNFIIDQIVNDKEVEIDFSFLNE